MINADSPSTSRRSRALFLSDIHLGTPHCQAALLLDFLKTHDASKIYLVGDIIDVWRLRDRYYWPASHAAVVDAILEKRARGAEIFFIPGNHDEVARRYVGRRVRDVKILDEMVHETAEGRRYLVIHGDQYDVVLRRAKWLAYLGDRFYAFALSTNTWLNRARGALGLEYWSLGRFAKRHVKAFVNIIGQYEIVFPEEVRRRGLDGVVCGHIHHAESRVMGGIHYVNTGDWVESCTAVVESDAGDLEILYWAETARRRKSRSLAPRPRSQPGQTS